MATYHRGTDGEWRRLGGNGAPEPAAFDAVTRRDWYLHVEGLPPLRGTVLHGLTEDEAHRHARGLDEPTYTLDALA